MVVLACDISVFRVGYSEKVSIGKMRETSSSSLTLLNVTTTAPLQELVQSQQKSLFVVRPICRSSVFRGIKPAYFLLIVVGLLFLNIESCNAKRHARQPPQLRTVWKTTGYGSQYASNAEGGNNGYENSDVYSNNENPYNEYPANQDDLSGVLIDQKDTNVETIRFANPARTSFGLGKHHKTKHHSLPSNDMRGNDDGDYLEREPLENNDVQKIGLSTQALKSLAEQVADSILVEADKLYESLKRGNGGWSVVADGQGKLSDSNVGNFVICDDSIRKM